jgi:glycosyltransferase involved in cell wall biosynthesis
LKNDLVQRGINPDKIFLVPNGVNTDRFVAQDPDHALVHQLALQDRACFGFIGSLYPWEGVEHLIRAIPQVVSQIPNACCLVVGGGPQEAMLRNLIRQLELDDYVTLTGSVPYDQILRYYSIMDPLVYPRISTRNTEMCTPLKPLEAMAMQKAVLGSSVGGIRELMPNGVGLQCQPGNSQDIAAKCVHLLSQPELRKKIGRAAHESVTQQRDWKNLVRRYVEVYEAAKQRCKH